MAATFGAIPATVDRVLAVVDRPDLVPVARPDPYVGAGACCGDGHRQGGAPKGPQLGDDLRIALTEALNNVVEHAGQPDGVPVCVSAGVDEDRVWVMVEDSGTRLPSQLLAPPVEAVGDDIPVPTGDPEIDGEIDFDAVLQGLPEGGWGWMLIRSTMDEVHYERRGDRNRLMLVRRCRVLRSGATNGAWLAGREGSLGIG
ncbi:MAG: ATP-binding protein [Pseudomonadota bacterium]